MEVNELANLYRKKFPAGTHITENQIVMFLTPVYERFWCQAPNAAATGCRLWEIVDCPIPHTYNKDEVKRIMNNQRLQALRQAWNNRHANNEHAAEANGNFAVNNVEDANDDNDNNSFEEEDDSVVEDDNSIDDSNAEDDSVVKDGNGEEDANGTDDSSIADNSEDANGEGDCHSVVDDVNGEELLCSRFACRSVAFAGSMCIILDLKLKALRQLGQALEQLCKHLRQYKRPQSIIDIETLGFGPFQGLLPKKSKQMQQ
jgi:hypothetical protein